MYDDILDTRELETKIEELREEIEDTSDVEDRQDLEEKLTDLLTLRESVNDTFDSSWDDGMTLIADSHFEEYAEQTAKDTGLINGETEGWPFRCIDWSEAAEELKNDYEEFTLDGVIYWGQEA